jgi:hypothetical protein
MIHETLKSGGSVTQAKRNYQELIVTLMTYKCSLGNVFLFHMDLLVVKTEIKFGEVLSTTQFIQEVINDMNGKFVFDGEFVEGMKIRTHAPSSFFIEYHDHRRRKGVGTRMDSICFKQFLNNFLNFILLGKGMMIRANIGRNIVWDERNGMIMDDTGRGNSLGSGKNIFVSGEYRFEVEMHSGCHNGVNGMELGDNVGMTLFFRAFLFDGN